MKIVRWLLFLPVAVVIAFGAWGVMICDVSYYGFRWRYVFATLVGITPMILQNVIALVLFVTVSSWIAPAKKKPVAIVCALIGGVFTLPIPEWTVDITFPLIGWCSRATGAVLGMIIVFYLLGRKKQPNQTLQPTTMSVTDRACARSAPATVVADL